MASDEGFDLQLRKGFRDLQVKVVEQRKEKQRQEQQKEKQRQERRIAELTREQLQALPPGNPVYKTVGRIFVLDSVETSIADQTRLIETATERMSAIDKQGAYLDKSLAESERALRELIQSRR